MIQKINNFFTDMANVARYRPHARKAMDNMARDNLTESEATEALSDIFKVENPIAKQHVGVAGLCLSIALISGNFILGPIGLWKLTESFEKIPFTDRANPLRSQGLRPEKQYERAQKIIKKHYHKRFK